LLSDSRSALAILPFVIYNFPAMPTPFNHLVFAQELLDASGLSATIRQILAAERPAFYFGNIAPDVQTITGQPREATHFFPVPIGDAPPAHERLFFAFPELSRPSSLSRPQAAFVAGYLAHLEWDQLWIRDIFEPFFGPQQTWSEFRERLYLHNAFRAHWDARDLLRLPASAGAELRAAQPQAWLPFIADEDLQRWRDLVADQLAPEGAARTVEVFAQRMDADPQAFAALVNSPEEMQRRVFAYIPLDRLAQFRADGLIRCADRLQSYFSS
jgi:hypothetical protein